MNIPNDSSSYEVNLQANLSLLPALCTTSINNFCNQTVWNLALILPAPFETGKTSNLNNMLTNGTKMK